MVQQYNVFEQSILDSSNLVADDMFNESLMITSNGTSKSVARVIFKDVKKLYPNMRLDDLDELNEIASHYEQPDGLLPVTYFKEMAESYSVQHIQQQIQIGFTTIWIAHYTRPLPGISNNAGKITKRQLDFQACLLAYFFNLIVGNASLRISNFSRNRTVKKYGLWKWYFEKSAELETQKLFILFDIMHKCAFEYWNDDVMVRISGLGDS